MTRIESFISALDEVRDQRDALYASSVNPRRNVGRALKVLQGENVGGISAIEFLEDALRDLDQLAALYRDQVQAPL